MKYLLQPKIYFPLAEFWICFFPGNTEKKALFINAKQALLHPGFSAQLLL